MVGPEVYSGGGFPLIYDCVGNRSSVAQSLAFASPRGRIVVIGCVARVQEAGSHVRLGQRAPHPGSGRLTDRKAGGGERRHTFEIAHDLLLETGAPVQDMVTHVYPLGQFRDALRAAANHRKSGAVKVVLQP